MVKSKFKKVFSFSDSKNKVGRIASGKDFIRKNFNAKIAGTRKRKKKIYKILRPCDFAALR